VVTAAFAFLALTEVCAAGTANAADSAMKRWAEGQQTAAALNFRYAKVLARIARGSAGSAGFTAGLFGFLAVGKQAADRAYHAHERAEFEFAQTQIMWGNTLGRR
jgi:hypothetical protein